MKKTKSTGNVKTLRTIRDLLNRKLEGLSSAEILAYFAGQREASPTPARRKRTAARPLAKRTKAKA